MKIIKLKGLHVYFEEEKVIKKLYFNNKKILYREVLFINNSFIVSKWFYLDGTLACLDTYKNGIKKGLQINFYNKDSEVVEFNF